MAGLVERHGGVAARRRALVVCGVLVEGAKCGRLDGTGGKSVGGRAGEALMARVLECPAARAGRRKGGERNRVERERERSTF